MKTFTSGILPLKVKVARIFGNWVESMLKTGPGWISREKRLFTPSGFRWSISTTFIIGIIVSICKSRLLSWKEERNEIYQTKLVYWVRTSRYIHILYLFTQANKMKSALFLYPAPCVWHCFILNVRHLIVFIQFHGIRLFYI